MNRLQVVVHQKLYAAAVNLIWTYCIT